MVVGSPPGGHALSRPAHSPWHQRLQVSQLIHTPSNGSMFSALKPRTVRPSTTAMRAHCAEWDAVRSARYVRYVTYVRYAHCAEWDASRAR